MLKSIFLGMLLAATLTAAAVDAEVHPRLGDLLKKLDLDRPELAGVKNAPTPLEQQRLLLAHFRARPAEKPDAAAPGEAARKIADRALEHVFTGQSAYPPSPRGKEIDWDSSPVPDREWLWQFHRFNWLPELAEVYRATGDERYAAEWVLEIRSWSRHMMTPANDPKHPGWRTLDTGIRMRNWATTFDAFIGSAAADGATLVEFLWALNRHAERIAALYPDDADPDHVGNWDVTQLQGLLFVAAVFPEYAKSREYAQQAVTRMSRFQKRVILPDGVIDEFIPSYHMAYPGQFSQVREICAKYNIDVEFPEDYDRYIEKSIDAVVIWSHPDGSSPVFGDTSQGKPGANREWIKRYLDRFHRPDWRFFATAGREGKAPEGRLHELPDAGYYTIRSGWDADAVFLVAKNTFVKKWRGHNQNDNLTFELSAYGRRLMIDSGCYNYSGEPEWRQFFRQPRAHQMVSLDDLPVAARGRKVLSRSVPGLDVLVLENEANAGFRHRRSFLFIDNRYFLILDEISGDAAGRLRQHFQFVPGPWTMDGDRLSARTMFADGPNLLVKTMAQPGLSLHEEEGWIAPKYMKKEPRPAFAFAQDKPDGGKKHFLTLVAPLPKTRQIFQAELGFLDNDGKPTDRIEKQLYLRLNRSETYRIGFDVEANAFSLEKSTGPAPREIENQQIESGAWQPPPLVPTEAK
jgi:heparan-sulfate lyase